jgi:hypothetical protein
LLCAGGLKESNVALRSYTSFLMQAVLLNAACCKKKLLNVLAAA